MALALAGCGRRPSVRVPEKDSAQPRPAIETSVQGLVLSKSDAKGRRVYELRSASSSQSELSSQATVKDAVITLFHEGKPNIIVRAPQARVDAKTRDVVMWGGLNARAVREQAAFRVDRMVWNVDTKQFLGTGNVRYTYGSATFWADNLSGSTPVTRVHLGNSVRFEIGPAAPKGQIQ